MSNPFGLSASLAAPGGGVPDSRGASVRGYWALSRTVTYSLTFAIPLLVAYEILVLQLDRATGTELRNLGDWVIQALLGSIGIHGPAGVTAALIGIAVVMIARERLRSPVPVRLRVFGGMLLESAILGLAFGSVVRLLTMGLLAPLRMAMPLSAARQLAALTPYEQVVLALGAGIYEELVFRAFLITAITAGLLVAARAVGARMPREVAIGVAVVISSLLFSLFHYVGPFGDAFQVWSFAYRFVAGLAFSAIFALRGFGIVAWTHALYDVFLILAGP